MLICDISILNRYGKQRLDDKLAPLGLDWHHLVVLLVLDQAPGITQVRLAPFLQTDKANVTKILQAMEQTGLLMRRPQTDDHRIKTCWLSSKGERLVPQLQRIMDEWEAGCFTGISPEEIEKFSEISSRIVNNLLRDWPDRH